MVHAVCVPWEGAQRGLVAQAPQFDGVIPAAAEEQVLLSHVAAKTAALLSG